MAAFGIIARDSGGSALLWRCGRAMVSSAIAIEAWALRIACVMAMEQGYSDVIFETDCQNLFRYVSNSKTECPWEIEAIVNDIRKWASYNRWSFRWCGRNLNKAAHWVASQCRKVSNFFLSGCIPPALESVLSKDVS